MEGHREVSTRDFASISMDDVADLGDKDIHGLEQRPTYWPSRALRQREQKEGADAVATGAAVATHQKKN